MQRRLQDVTSVQKIEVVMEKLSLITWTVSRYGFPMKYACDDFKKLLFFKFENC